MVADLHPNSMWLMEWCDRMVAKYGQPIGVGDWCRKLAEEVNELGNNHPSNQAILVAKKWESDPPPAK